MTMHRQAAWIVHADEQQRSHTAQEKANVEQRSRVDRPGPAARPGLNVGDGKRSGHSPRLCSRAHSAALLLLLLGAMGCTADPGSDDAAPPAAADTSAAAAPAGTVTDVAAPDVPADEQGTEPATPTGSTWTAADTNVERPSAGAAVLREVRTAGHEAFDRIVLDFGADAVPNYRISYIDSPVRQCGSGNPVSLAGDAWLSITVQPANAHTEEGEPTVRERERTPGLPVLLELKLICDFEAMVEIVAGVESPEQYRSFVLESPNRLVVDIEHPR